MNFKDKSLVENYNRLKQVREGNLSEDTERRYVVTIEAYVYASNDGEAQKKANELAMEMDQKYDNKASVSDVVEQPSGKLGNRPVD